MKIRLAIIIFCITLILMVVVIDSFHNEKSNTPKKSDVIIMVGGDHGRMEKAAELYTEEYAEYVIITPEISTVYSQSTEFAIELGVPKSAIIREPHATSTYTNAIESLKIMEEYGFESAIVVTSDYHLKRSKMIYERVNNEQYALKYVVSPNTNDETLKEKTNSYRIWFSEFYKLWAYRLGLYKFFDTSDRE